MQDHIRESLGSVLNQLNDEFEVVVVDDGSSDGSVKILQAMSQQFKNLRVFSYPRDSGRLLGYTRNLSVEHALGKYVVLHIDADDIWDHGIVEWCEKAKQLSIAMGDDVYISGKQINMVSKKFLMNFGGYRNIFYTEDRDLWMRLAAQKKILFIEHKLFRARMKLSSRVRYRKLFKVMWNVLLNDLRTGPSVLSQLTPVLADSCLSAKTRGLKNAVFRILVFPVAALFAVIKGPVENFRPSVTPSIWKIYKENNTRTFDEWIANPNIK